MTTVSAIIFLVTADTRVATAYILNRVEDGEYGVAIAYGSILIVVMMAIILFFDRIVGDTRIAKSKAKKAIKLLPTFINVEPKSPLSRK